MKQRIHKLTIVIGIIGIITIITSTIRWLFLFPDRSQFAIAVGIGVVFLGFAYIYETIKRIDIELVKIREENAKQKAEFDTAMDALNIYYREEIDKLKEKIKELGEQKE